MFFTHEYNSALHLCQCDISHDIINDICAVKGTIPQIISYMRSEMLISYIHITHWLTLDMDISLTEGNYMKDMLVFF